MRGKEECDYKATIFPSPLKSPGRFSEVSHPELLPLQVKLHRLLTLTLENELQYLYINGLYVLLLTQWVSKHCTAIIYTPAPKWE